MKVDRSRLIFKNFRGRKINKSGGEGVCFAFCGKVGVGLIK